MKHLIVCLGNIGPEYQYTRHNVGFLVADMFSSKYNKSFETKKLGDIMEFRLKNKIVYILKPSTFMNLSGKAYKYWLEVLSISIENSIVIVDDLSLPFGQLRLKTKGSNNGHNGLANIESALSTSQYPRLKIGIGSNFEKGNQVNYVLGKWTTEETENIPQILKNSIDTIEYSILSGIDKAMNIYNSK